MSKSIFVSYVFENKETVKKIKNWCNEGKLGEVNTVYFDTDMRNLGTKTISNHIKSKIEGAAAVFVLIGNDTHNHDWIKKEVEYANSFHKKIVCIRIPGTSGAVPPILANYQPIEFNLTSIRNAM